MTLAPRVQVFTQLSCNQLYHDHSYNTFPIYNSSQFATLYVDHIHSDPATPYYLPSFDSSVPPSPPQNTCSSDPAVQSRTARFQTIMVTTMGLMSALTTGWWGHFSERHGRIWVLIACSLGPLIKFVHFHSFHRTFYNVFEQRSFFLSCLQTKQPMGETCASNLRRCSFF
jgi:hypothetical protein